MGEVLINSLLDYLARNARYSDNNDKIKREMIEGGLDCE